MRRFALTALVLLMALPAAAAAKGPHASLSVPAEAPRPGEFWTAKLWLSEFARDKVPPPVVIARRGSERMAFAVQPLSAYVSRHPDVLRERRYRLRGVFPSAGEWLITVIEGPPLSRRFRFAPLEVGGASPTRDLFALPGEPPMRGAPLPPEVVAAPPSTARNEDEPARLWIPAVALLAVAGAFTLLRRRVSS